MLSKIRKRITYANVAMTLALVMAMSGGAYAASKYIITSIKQIKPSVVAQLKGKNGANGKNGAQGVSGVAGEKGVQGPVGPQGEKGEKGAPGSSGLTGTTGPKGATGPTGLTGPTGQTGYVKTLPSGATETGTWFVHGTDSAAGETRSTVISFPIPLASALAGGKTSYVKIGDATPATCVGDVEKPGAEPDQLCIFEGETPGVHKAGLKFGVAFSPSGIPNGFKPSANGAALLFETETPGTPGEEVTAEGTFAVTAE